MQGLARVALLAVAVAALVVGVLLAAFAQTIAGLVLLAGGGAGLWLLVGLGALRHARGPATSAPAPREVPLPTGALPSLDELAALPFPLTTCPDCGYPAVRALGLRDGAVPGGGETGARFVCPRCGFQGIPIEFERREDYREFLEALQGGA